MKIPLAFELGVPRKDGRIIQVDNFITQLQKAFEDRCNRVLVTKHSSNSVFGPNLEDVIGIIQSFDVTCENRINQSDHTIFSSYYSVVFDVNFMDAHERYVIDHIEMGYKAGVYAQVIGAEEPDNVFYVTRIASFYIKYSKNVDSYENPLKSIASNAIKELEKLKFKVLNFRLQI